MSDTRDAKPHGRPSKKELRTARLAEELRANLKRRKSAGRERAGPKTPDISNQNDTADEVE